MLTRSGRLILVQTVLSAIAASHMTATQTKNLTRVEAQKRQFNVQDFDTMAP
jgi:hypothetical protein